MQRQLLDYHIGIGLGSGGGIQEWQEDVGLLREYTDQFEGTNVDEVEEFVDGGGAERFPT